MTKFLNNSPELKKRRRDLRNNLTKAEVTLWKYIKGNQLEGRKFRRQFSVGNYILDFYCFEEKLAIELDGKEHYTEGSYEYDLSRDSFLKAQGITILRFENEDIFKCTEEVLEKIKSYFKSK
jgi:very-short-patch-repair endonuclease